MTTIGQHLQLTGRLTDHDVKRVILGLSKYADRDLPSGTRYVIRFEPGQFGVSEGIGWFHHSDMAADPAWGTPSVRWGNVLAFGVSGKSIQETSRGPHPLAVADDLAAMVPLPQTGAGRQQ